MCESRSAFCMTIANAYTRIKQNYCMLCVSMDGAFLFSLVRIHNEKGNDTKRNGENFQRRNLREKKRKECTKRRVFIAHSQANTELSDPKRITHKTREKERKNERAHKRQHADFNVLESPPCVYTQSASIYIKIYFSDFGIFLSLI